MYGDAAVREYRTYCAEWPDAALPADFFEAPRGDVPVALVAGALDPITPPELAAGVARQLPRARFITVPRGRHIIEHPCIDSLRSALFETANAEGLETTCVAGIGGTPFHIPPRTAAARNRSRRRRVLPLTAGFLHTA